MSTKNVEILLIVRSCFSIVGKLTCSFQRSRGSRQQCQLNVSPQGQFQFFLSVFSYSFLQCKTSILFVFFSYLLLVSLSYACQECLLSFRIISKSNSPWKLSHQAPKGPSVAFAATKPRTLHLPLSLTFMKIISMFSLPHWIIKQYLLRQTESLQVLQIGEISQREFIV